MSPSGPFAKEEVKRSGWPRPLAAALLRSPWVYIVMAGAIFGLDFLTEAVLGFPVLFILPVGLCAWFASPRLAMALALALPAGRFVIAAAAEARSPEVEGLNAVVRMAVLALIAYLVARTARQTAELRREVKIMRGMLPTCMFCKKIRDEKGNWTQMEAYISERSEARFSHTFCPDCGEKHYGEFLPKGQGGAAREDSAE